MGRKNFIAIILLLYYICISHGQPIENITDNKLDSSMKNFVKKDKLENVRYAKKETKKDIFLSRGWGAGGMPFSVLYMNPTYSSKQSNVYEYRTGGNHLTKSGIQMLGNQNKPKNGNNRSTIPHLFVSYGWGPLGKK